MQPVGANAVAVTRPELPLVIERLRSEALLSFVDYRCATVDGQFRSSTSA